MELSRGQLSGYCPPHTRGLEQVQEGQTASTAGRMSTTHNHVPGSRTQPGFLAQLPSGDGSRNWAPAANTGETWMESPPWSNFNYYKHLSPGDATQINKQINGLPLPQNRIEIHPYKVLKLTKLYIIYIKKIETSKQTSVPEDF